MMDLMVDLNDYVDDKIKMVEMWKHDESVTLHEEKIINYILSNNKFTVNDMMSDYNDNMLRIEHIDIVIRNKKCTKVNKLITVEMMEDLIPILDRYDFNENKTNVCDMNVYHSIICDYVLDSRINDKRLNTLGPLDLIMLKYLCKCYMQRCECKHMANCLMIINVSIIIAAIILT